MAAPRPHPLLLLLLVALLAASADAWGKEGHIMVCKIAEVRYLLLLLGWLARGWGATVWMKEGMGVRAC